MTPSSRSNRLLSTAGTALPVLCAIHCLLMPVLLTLAPVLLRFEGIERWILPPSILIATWAVLRDMKLHSDRRPSGVLAVGVLLWCVSLVLRTPEAAERSEFCAQLFVSGAAIWNLWLGHTRADCDHCDCESGR